MSLADPHFDESSHAAGPSCGGTGAEALTRFVQRHPRLFVLSGAGISTASGIPDYRDEQGRWKRKSPMQMAEFLASAAARRRYWARSMAGWPVVARARPNRAHAALATLQDRGLVQRLVTQNVDGLHQQAGSREVIELHGSLDRVVCLGCGDARARVEVQQWLEAANPSFAPPAAGAPEIEPAAAQAAAPAPDGDADVEPGRLDGFRLPECGACGGVLKPDVVFFGDTVPRERVTQAMASLAQSDALLVLGSSLMLYSGYRFCDAARRAGQPIAAVNLGHTRADPLLQIKVERPCAEVLQELVSRLFPHP